MHAQPSIVKIISGGQTGADRGGLEAAIEAGIRHGGTCPRGRKAEDGAIPGKYALTEHTSPDYLARTEANVIDGHCTVVFTFGKATGGSKRTVELARKYQRSCLCVDLASMSDKWAAEAILQWLSPGGLVSESGPFIPPFPVLNVAGSRESNAPGIQDRVRRVMMAVLCPKNYPEGAE